MARRFARALVGGATVAGVVGGGLALCDASGAPADALRSFFGAPRVGPGGGAGADAGDDSNALTEKETTDRRYEDERESEGADGDDDAASSSDAAAETSRTRRWTAGVCFFSSPRRTGRRCCLPSS